MADGKTAEVLTFPSIPSQNLLALEGQLRNLLVLLRQHHGATTARLMLAEAAIRVIADDARAQDALAATRFAMEIGTEHAFAPAPFVQSRL